MRICAGGRDESVGEDERVAGCLEGHGGGSGGGTNKVRTPLNEEIACELIDLNVT